MATITGHRLGKPDRIERDFPKGAIEEWPAIFITFFRGQANFDVMLSAAQTPGRFNGPEIQTCEAYFLAGEWRLAEGNMTDAKTFLTKAVDQCEHNGMEWPTAREELARFQVMMFP